jgi:hypothetical protein
MIERVLYELRAIVDVNALRQVATFQTGRGQDLIAELN